MAKKTLSDCGGYKPILPKPKKDSTKTPGKKTTKSQKPKK